MTKVPFWTLVPLILSYYMDDTVQAGLELEDPSMDPVLELLLQEELAQELPDDESVEALHAVGGGGMRLEGGEWRCGECGRPSRPIYSETTLLELTGVSADGAGPQYAEYQVGVSPGERVRCVRVRGAGRLRARTAPAPGAAPPASHVVTVTAYGD